MSYPIEKKLVVAISANALFNLSEEQAIYEKEGLEAYRKHQIKNKLKILQPGSAFPFIKRLLYINEVYTEERPIEVVLLSKNSPETGIRIFNSIKHYKLDITRAAFMSGSNPYKFIPAFNVSLYLSTNKNDVELALKNNYAAGRVIGNEIIDDIEDKELRIAFDFDGVIADDEAEKIFKTKGLNEFEEYENTHRCKPLKPGPLADFFKKISFFQELETLKNAKDNSYKKILKTAIITARSSPAHERAVNTLNKWGVTVDEMFLLGGVEKKRVLEIMKPHLYLDDQMIHLNDSIKNIPFVHIPFGISNE